MYVQIGDQLVIVNEEILERLNNDPVYRAQYEAPAQVRNSNLDAKSNREITLWRSPKCPTEEDDRATRTLLNLRLNYKHSFDDKKTSKQELWGKIADELNTKGFFVGEGTAGKEKVRQKFYNMQTSYMKYKDSQRRTGEGRLKIPKFYEELEEILGDKHKAQPALIIDSASAESVCKASLGPQAGCTEGVPSTSSVQTEELLESTSPGSSLPANTPQTSRFTAVRRSVRPTSERKQVLQELLNFQKQVQLERSQQFQAMLSLFQQQSEQRNQQILSLIETMGKQRRGKKRRRSSEDSE